MIDALVVGMDLLVKHTGKKKYERRIFLVTEASGPCNTDDLQTVLSQFQKIEVRLNVM